MNYKGSIGSRKGRRILTNVLLIVEFPTAGCKIVNIFMQDTLNIKRMTNSNGLCNATKVLKLCAMLACGAHQMECSSSPDHDSQCATGVLIQKCRHSETECGV